MADATWPDWLVAPEPVLMGAQTPRHSLIAFRPSSVIFTRNTFALV
jgi:hypothetical protein